MAISTNLINRDINLGYTAKPVTGNLITGESYQGPSGTAAELLPSNTTNETEPGDTRSTWEKVQDGWNDFLDKVGDAINLHNQTSNGGFANLPIDTITEVMAGPTGNAVESSTDVGGDTTDTSNIDSDIDEALSGSPSVSDYIRNNPGASMEDVLKWMSTQSDEWAEKYMDYILEKQSINEQNAYTASREDTAYQRLVQDLRKAGLNPAMMYGSTAGTSSQGSQGVVKASEGATSRSLSNYDKMKRLLLAYMTYSLQLSTGLLKSSSGIFATLASFL